MYENIAMTTYICQDYEYADVMDVTASDTRDLALALHELSWRIARFGPAQVGLEPLPASEVAVLRAVLEQPGRGVSDAAASIAMQPSNVSAAVRSLVARGLIEKRPDPDDKRMTLLHPTARARKDRSAIETALAGSVSQALGELSDEHVGALLRAVPAMRALSGAVTEMIR